MLLPLEPEHADGSYGSDVEVVVDDDVLVGEARKAHVDTGAGARTRVVVRVAWLGGVGSK